MKANLLAHCLPETLLDCAIPEFSSDAELQFVALRHPVLEDKLRKENRPIVPMTLEQAIAYIEDDELVEVTPKSIRLRKRFLSEHERKRAARDEKAA